METIAEQSAMYAERALATRTPKGGLCRLSTGGKSRDYETRLVPYGEDEALVIARDITDQTRTEEELQLFLGITLTTSEVADLRTALTVVLRQICESTGWVVGAAWMPGDHGALQCDAVWLTRDTPDLRAFRGLRGPRPHPAVCWEAPRREGVGRGARRVGGRPSRRSRRPRARGNGGGVQDRLRGPGPLGHRARRGPRVLRLRAPRRRRAVAHDGVRRGGAARGADEAKAGRGVGSSPRVGARAAERADRHLRGLVIGRRAPNRVRQPGVLPHDGLCVGGGARTRARHAHGSGHRPRRHRPRAGTTCSEGRVVEFEAINYRKDGSQLPVEWRVAPARAPDGTISHFIAIQRDITQRRQVELARLELQRALETAASQWRLTFDAIESPIFLLDRDAPRPAHQPRGEVPRRRTDYKGAARAPARQRSGTGEPWRAGAAIVRAALQTRTSASVQARDEARKQTWDFAATPIDDEGNEKVILVVREITHFVELQESLRRSETLSAMGTLVAGVAHEVRNPLHAITVTLDAFESRFRVAEHASHINVLRGEVARLTTLMRDLLEYGKPAASRPYPGRVAEIIAQSVSVCAREAQEREVKVESRIDPALPAVFIDPERLLQVMNNVLQNAIQHSKPAARVIIAAQLSHADGARWVECTVSDEGPGFREADLGRVFEPFFTRRKGGTGLGLSIVQRIVDMHRGRVWASNRPGFGRVGGEAGVITMRLPVPEVGAYDSKVGS